MKLLMLQRCVVEQWLPRSDSHTNILPLRAASCASIIHYSHFSLVYSRRVLNRLMWILFGGCTFLLVQNLISFSVFLNLGLDARVIVECVFLPVISVLLFVSFLKERFIALFSLALVKDLRITIQFTYEVAKVNHCVEHTVRGFLRF